DGWLCAAAAIAGRAGLGARTLGAHTQRTRAVDPGDGAAARGNLGEIYPRHADRMPGAVHEPRDIGAAANLVFRRSFVFSVTNETGLRGGAAHVEREEIELAGL